MIYHYKKQQPEIIPGGAGDGTKSNPWYWYSLTQGQTINIDNSNISEDNGRLYIRVKLNAGTTYYIGETGPGGGDGKIWLYDENGNELTYNDDWDMEIAGVYCWDHFEYTPSNTGIYIIGAGAYSESRGSYTVAISQLPEYDPVPQPEVVYHTSTGFNNFGKAIKYRSAKNADCNNIIIPKEGLILYVPCEVDVNVKIGKQFTNQGSYAQKIVQGISCLKFSSPCTTSIDTSVYSTKYTTLSAWFYNIKGSNTSPILGYGYDQPYNAFCLEEYQGQFTIERAYGHFDTNYIMNDNTWYHLAVTLNDNVIIAYVNGEPIKTITYSMNLNIGGNIGLGGWIDGGYSPNGYITHCRIYNRALDEKEIKILSKEFKIQE